MSRPSLSIGNVSSDADLTEKLRYFLVLNFGGFFLANLVPTDRPTLISTQE